MKAVSLFSGGLDSQLAVCLLKDQGIEVIAVNFVTPFFGADKRFSQAASDLGVEYHEINIGPIYMDVLRNPVYGYGKNFNPCIDCHAFMLKNAAVYMREIGASFLITGEVLGERPMSQNKSSLSAVEKHSGCKGLILRPLSAKLLPPTIPEIEGWVDRNQLLDISGRSRIRQMQLAEYYGIKDYPTPAGGCLLTQENFSKRLRRIIEEKPDIKMDEFEILRLGRHFYLGAGVLLVVGRNHSENERLLDLAVKDDYILRVTDRPGPVGLVRLLKPANDPDLQLAAGIVARYSDARDLPAANLAVVQPGIDNKIMLTAIPLSPGQVPPTV
ncbi:MAG: tRNA 4-thiouridine(8) synthase ThiI [Syntrophomonadaceae bacterium]|nr:tRNA 4-thiouridine(8) synthase ThiI [Syntrophomonadaceae bacterium]